jgi:hypothetical protein
VSICRWSGPRIDVSRGPFNFWKTTPYKVVFGCASCAPRQGETGFAFPIVRFHPGSSCPQAAALRQSHTRGRRPPPFPRDSCVSWHTVNLRGAHLAPIIRTSEHFHVFSPPPHLSVRMFGSGVKKRANSPRLSPRRNAPLVAAASRRSRARKRSVFDRRPRIGNCAMMATASNGPSASGIFRKRSALFETWVTWLKPKAITLISASAGATRPSRCAQRRSRDCMRTILSWRARSIGCSGSPDGSADRH